jgi:hypothetical protein
MNIRLVQFHNGKYGIQKRSVLQRLFGNDGEFQDLKNIKYSWTKKSEYFKDCQSVDFNLVSEVYLVLTSSVVKCEIKQKRLEMLS